MKNLPTGTVTFLFTDIEGSTRLLQQLKDGYADVLAECRRLIRTAVKERGGVEVDTEGDAVFAAFPSAREALLAAVAAQQHILGHSWPDNAAVRVRMGLHTGEATIAKGGYVGMDVHRAARICAAAHGGQILLSDTASALVTKDLPDGVSLSDLGEHRLKDLAHPHHLFQVLAPNLPVSFLPLRSLSANRQNLPIQLTSFIGREREIAEVKTALAADRLVTLTGAGGSGKTRLALQVGADLFEQYSDGVWLVELAALTDPALVPQTVATALGVPEQPSRTLTETLVDALRPESLLLLLDNCEHLLAACAGLTDVLLRACPTLSILATSREGLGIAGEVLYPVPTLPVPDSDRLPPMEDLVRYESVRLFAERATAVLPTFTLSSQNARSVAQICRYLDGIPLAIELAAVRVKALAVDQIVSRLSDRFRLLTGGSRTAPPRHQTLQAAINWSYGLLSEKEEVVLRRLSVFAGGCTLEAAEAICSGNAVAASEVLDLLARLVDKSLVVAETRQHGDARYRLLETVRQYASQRLVDSGDDEEVHARHRDWYLALAERAELKLFGGSDRGPSQAAWLDHLEREHDNLRAALEWSIASDKEGALQLAATLGVFWEDRGHLREGLERLLGAIERRKENDLPALHAKALYYAGRLAQGQADISAARRYYEESLKIRRNLGDKEGTAWSLRSIGTMLVYQGDSSAARPLLEESLTIFRALGQLRGIAATLGNLGNLARVQGDYATALRLGEESLAISRNLEDQGGIAWGLPEIGRIKAASGDLAGALRLFQESLPLVRELHDPRIAWVLVQMGDVEWLMGDSEAARVHFEESLAIFKKLGEKQGMGWAFCGLGDVALLRGDHVTAKGLNTKGLILFREVGLRPGILSSLARLAEVAWACQFSTHAARLIGAAEVLREGLGGMYRKGRPHYTRTVAEVRGALGEEAFSAACAEGRVMMLEQAIEYALAAEST